MSLADPHEPLLHEVESAVGAAHPEVEVVDVELVPRQGLLRVLLDREGGVDLALCEDVTRLLAPLRARYALEVSSPGLDRPLTRPHHFTRAVGEVVKVQLREPLDGRRKVVGRLVGADEASLRVRLDEGAEVEIPRAIAGKSNVVWSPEPR